LVAAGWWPPSRTPTATSWGCFRTDERRPRSGAQRRRDTEHRLTHDTPYRWFRISPRRIPAWREVNEPPDRELTRDGRWLV
jgi:hypothetical protein